MISIKKWYWHHLITWCLLHTTTGKQNTENRQAKPVAVLSPLFLSSDWWEFQFVSRSGVFLGCLAFCSISAPNLARGPKVQYDWAVNCNSSKLRLILMHCNGRTPRLAFAGSLRKLRPRLTSSGSCMIGSAGGSSHPWCQCYWLANGIRTYGVLNID